MHESPTTGEWMRRNRRRCAGFLLAAGLFTGQNIAAEPAAIVEGLQLPAWIERAQNRQPLHINMLLQSGDKLTTGAGARVVLRLAEGSHLTLGENTRIKLRQIDPATAPDGIFNGVLEVGKGTFRFSTTPLSAAHLRKIHLHTISHTVTILGADVWGEASTTNDRVALIEGRIMVRQGDGEPFFMEQPLTISVVDRNGAAQPVADIDQAVFSTELAPQTQLINGRGVMRPDGRWQVNLMTIFEPGKFTSVMRRLHEAGYPAQTRATTIDGRQRTRLIIAGFSGRDEARAVADRLDGRYGLKDVWVSPGVQATAANR